MAKNDTYGEPTIIEYPGMIVRIYRPVLTEEERSIRMKRLHDAAASLLMSVEKTKG